MIAATEERTSALLAGLAGRGDAVLARAPGRVNLIGEHTDYNGLPVLPFAIERDVLVAGRTRRDDVVEAANVDPTFPPRCFPPREPITAFPAGDWGNYVKAATRTLLGAGVSVRPASLRVHGTIPAAAGVSSSSALVVACALALESLAGGGLDRLALAELLARGEQFVGTLSGGMDQAAILLGRPGYALRLDFFPLRARPVAIPPDAAFVVAHSLEQAAKAGRARGLYNQRVIECRLACAALARRLGRELRHLGDLVDPAAVLEGLDGLLPDGVLSRAELASRLDLRAHEIERIVPSDVALDDPERFVLRARLRHVLAEAIRVTAAEQALNAGDLPALGALLDASHASGAVDYGTSTPAADALVQIGREAGALGGRLMGAGFGGAVLFLVERARAAAMIDALDRRFYGPTRAGPDVRFTVAASAGATVTRVDCPERV